MPAGPEEGITGMKRCVVHLRHSCAIHIRRHKRAGKADSETVRAGALERLRAVALRENSRVVANERPDAVQVHLQTVGRQGLGRAEARKGGYTTTHLKKKKSEESWDKYTDTYA